MGSRKLPEFGKNILMRWLMQHWWNPYPKEEEKKRLASQASLSLKQVDNWLTNARRRIIRKKDMSTCSSSDFFEGLLYHYVSSLILLVS